MFSTEHARPLFSPLTPPAGVNPSPGQLLTATATLTNNNGKAGSGTVGDTSEFSRPVTVVLSAT